MKRVSIAFFVFALLLTVTGCSENSGKGTLESTENGGDGIKFEYFYRGFTPVEDDSAMPEPGVFIILTDDDWHDYMDKYCPGIPYFTSVDYTKECLVAISRLGAKPSWNTSSEIQSVTVEGSSLQVINDDDITDSSKTIFALSGKDISQVFINIIKISKSELPEDITGVYKRNGD